MISISSDWPGKNIRYYSNSTIFKQKADKDNRIRMSTDKKDSLNKLIFKLEYKTWHVQAVQKTIEETMTKYLLFAGTCLGFISSFTSDGIQIL